MRGWLEAPVFEDAETSRQARMMLRVVRSMLLMVVVGCLFGLADARNQVHITLTFYALIVACLCAVVRVVGSGRVVLGAWILSLFFWLLIAAVTLAFGGLQGQSASLFAVCTLLIGSIVGGRAAIWMAVASSAWCGLVAVLEERGRLPWDLVPYTPANAWSAVTITVILTSVLLHESLKSLRRVHEQAERAAHERDEALRRSIQSQKMELVGNLTSGVAHDLNNLLTIITGTVGLLRDSDAVASDELRPLLDDLDDAASRSALMTGQLLALGRSGVAKGEPVNVGEVVEAHARMVTRMIGTHIEVNVTAEPGCWVLMPRSALEQIVLNLVVNARDAMQNGGSLRLAVRTVGQAVWLTVTDTGCGMSDEVRSKMFEPFFTTRPKGTGLGLPTIRRLVNETHGNLEVDSAVGEGTRFTVCWPKMNPAPLESRPPESHLARSRTNELRAQRPRVLLVEDDPMVRKTLSQALTASGYDVTAVADGDEAIVFTGILERFSCVVTDVAMRRLDGDALAEHLAISHPELPVIIMSGNREPRECAVGRKRRFLPKPVSVGDLQLALLELTNPPGATDA